MFLSEVTSCQFGVWETIQLHRSYCNRLHLRTCPYTCTAVAMPFCLILVLFMLFRYCMLWHYHIRCLMPALLLTIWGFDAFLSFYPPVSHRPKKNISDRYTWKNLRFGQQCLWNCLDLICFSFHLFSLKEHARRKPVYFSGGHSIWVNVWCYFTSCNEKCGDKNLICMTGAIWSQPGVCMDSIAPLIFFFFFFSNVAFFRAQRKDVVG